MDLTFSEAQPTPAERAVIDGLLGAPDSVWTGAADRSAADLRAARTGRTRDRRDELLPALDVVQSAMGWISEGALMHICRQLGVPPAEAYGVATFYELLSVTEQPPIVLHVCDDVGCRGFGATALIEDLEQTVSAAGDAATWVRSPCIGQCDRAPACFAQLAGTDDAVLVNTTADRVRAVLAGDDPPPTPDVAPPAAGQRANGLLRRVGVVDPTDLAAYRASGGYAALRRAIDLGPNGVIAEVKASGLRGRGGAAFPAHVKWHAVAQQTGPAYLICNADESEPGTFKDRTIMEGDPFALIEAMTIAGLAIGAETGYLYIRGEYPVATTRLRGAIAAARQAGLLGADVMGAGSAFDIDLRRGQGAYICGEETALINSIEGYRGEPRNKPPFPTDVGLFGKPTVINNVETLVNVPSIVLDGGEAFARVGTAESTGTRLFCLSGDVDQPGVYEVESGMVLRDLIVLAGGDPAHVDAVLLGGAAGAFVGREDLDLSLTFEDARAAGLGLGSGVVMVFGSGADLGDATTRIARFFRHESCGQCVPCRVGTVRVEEALGRFLDQGQDADGRARELQLIDELDQVMKDASICGLGHTAGTAIRSALDRGLLESRA